MTPTKVSDLHIKTPMITYGVGVPHKTSMHTYETVSDDHTQKITAHSMLIFPKSGWALGHTIDYM